MHTATFTYSVDIYLFRFDIITWVLLTQCPFTIIGEYNILKVYVVCRCNVKIKNILEKYVKQINK